MPGSFVDVVIREMYEKLDRVFEQEIVRGQPVTCRKGCAHCCYLLALTTIPEALYIAYEIAKWPDFRLWLNRIAAAAREVASCTDRREWFDRQIPCPFLEGDATCAVYAARPGCCRWHAVQTPVERCMASSEDNLVLRYNSQGLDLAMVEFAQDFHREHPEAGPVAIGPIPLAVLWALSFASQGREHRIIEKKLRGLPTLREWCDRWYAAKTKAKTALPVIAG